MPGSSGRKVWGGTWGWRMGTCPAVGAGDAVGCPKIRVGGLPTSGWGVHKGLGVVGLRRTGGFDVRGVQCGLPGVHPCVLPERRC